MPDWDEVYRTKEVAQSTPAQVLVENAHLLSDSGRALDYACGLGGNALYLASKGFDVIALDNSQVAVEKLKHYAQQQKLALTAECLDLEKNPADYQPQFDVIVVSYFLHRQTLDLLRQYLNTGGLLFYQTFSGHQVNGAGPSNPDFRLARGELLSRFSEMELLYYREDPIECPDDNCRPGQVLFVAKKLDSFNDA